MYLFRLVSRRPFIVLTIIYILSLVLLDFAGYFSLPSKNDVSRFISERRVNVEGKVVNVPGQKNNKVQLTVKVLSVNEQKATGKLAVILFSDYCTIEQGDLITFYAKLLPPPAARNPGTFDYAAYLRRNNIYAMTYISSFNKTGYVPLSFHQTIANKVRLNILDTIHRYLPQERASVLIPMLIGEKSELSDEVKESFRTVGLSHLLVVSGLNVGYVVLIFMGFFRLIGFKRRHAALFTIPFILLFMLIVGDNPPVVRATVMALFIIISLSLSRDPLIYQSLAMAAATILIFDPQALFTASFQLSFAATIGIVYLYPFFVKPFQNFPRWVQTSIGGTVAVSLAAQLAVLPIIAYYFSRISVIGIISNIVVVPWTGVITASGIVLYLAHFLSHFITLPVAYVTSLLLGWMLYFVRLFAEFPHSTVYVATPSILLIIVYYIFLTGIFHIDKLYRFAIPNIVQVISGKRYRYVLIPAIVTVPLIISAAVWQMPSNEKITITSLYAGNGTAVHIEFPDNRHWFIDTGRIRDGEKVLLPYLRSKGIRRIEKVIITSDEKHHYGGLTALTDNFPVSQIFYPQDITSTERFVIDKSTITLTPVTSKKDSSILAHLDYAGKRIVFVHGKDLSGDGEILTLLREKVVDVFHLSCHRNKMNLDQYMKLFRPNAVILSGMAREEEIKKGKMYTLKNDGAVSIVLTAREVRITTRKEDTAKDYAGDPLHEGFSP